MKNTRTANTFRNISWAFILQIVLMLLQFFSRTVFILQLGREYLGITGLFSDIMLLLGLANFRIPESIVLSMYKPLSDGNIPKVLAFFNFYRKVFIFIRVAILLLGLILIPILPFLIKEPPDIPENFTVIYLFFLTQLIISYFVIQKRSIIFADQKNYIINIYLKVFHYIQIIIQIIVLLLLRNFYLFLLVEAFLTILMNFLISIKADKMYPFIKEKCTYKLNKDEISEFFTNTKSMFFYGLGSIALIGIDSILVSSIVGIGILGLCSNYMLIINSVKAMVDQVMTGFTASIGNLNTKNNIEATENVFNQVNFIVFVVSAFLSINLAVSLSPLITVWLGDSFLISQTIVISLILRFYILGTQYTTFTFRSTLGLLKKLKYIPLVTAFVNIALSIIMGRFFGVAGIFFASSIAIFFFTIIPEALILYKNIFSKSSIMFFIRYCGFLIFMAVNYLITSYLLEQINFSGWIGFFAKAFCGAVISGLLFIVVFFRDRNFKLIFSRLIFIIKSWRLKNE